MATMKRHADGSVTFSFTSGERGARLLHQKQRIASLMKTLELLRSRASRSEEETVLHCKWLRLYGYWLKLHNELEDLFDEMENREAEFTD